MPYYNGKGECLGDTIEEVSEYKLLKACTKINELTKTTNKQLKRIKQLEHEIKQLKIYLLTRI